jgi:hypothetical protein
MLGRAWIHPWCFTVPFRRSTFDKQAAAVVVVDSGAIPVKRTEKKSPPLEGEGKGRGQQG